MSLLIHRAERADHLVHALGVLLSNPLPDPFATEIVSVPTPGVERWLSQRLAARLGTRPGRSDGVCAAVDFCSPGRLVARVLAVTGATADEEDPWRPDRMVWPLLRVLDESRDQPWARLLWSHLDGRAGRRWSVARHQAELFAAYAVSRPAMLQAWSAYRDVDPAGQLLGPDRAWQPELWRQLRAVVDAPPPTDRVAAAAEALRDRPGVVDLPNRLSVFGATRLEPDLVAVLAALAASREVHLWLPAPSPALWRKVAEHLERAGAPVSRRRAADRTEELVAHRLLAYLGRDARSCSSACGERADLTDDHLAPPPGPPPATLLQQLQADIAADSPPRPVADRPVLDPADRSVVLHAAHGPDRQVEVLREVLVGLLADDPSLEPRDIVVMCPDIEAFAPLIAAAFGLDTAEAEAEHPGHRLRVRLADRSLRQLNPLLAVISRLVRLADGRMPASAILDLCATGTGGPQVLLHRRRAGPAPGPHRPGGCPLGPRRRASGPLRAGRLRAEHLGRRAGPAAARAWPWTRASSASWARPCRWTTWTPPTST
jgi:exodeoxyribonuclease V gamma subunit